MKKILNSKFFLAVFLLFLIRFVFAFLIYHPDVRNHVDWGIRFFEYGPSKFYAPESNVWSYTWPNQPPGSILIYAFVRKLYEALYSFFWFLNTSIPLFPSNLMYGIEHNLYPSLLQLPAIIADGGIALLIYKILKRIKDTKTGQYGALLFLLNPVIWYNSAIWGQTDSIVNFFVLLAFYFVYKKKLFFSILSFAISLYIKVSLAVFAPIFLLILFKKYKVIDILKYSIVVFGIILLITLPFSVGSGKDPISFLVYLYQEKVLTEQLQVITANAFNLWATLTGIHERPHSLPLLGLTYQFWGYILFGFLFFPIFYSLWKKENEKKTYFVIALTAFISWMFLTNMHERYLYPLFPYLTIIAALNLTLIPIYWLISIVNLLNLYNFWWYPEISVVKQFLSFGDRLMPRVFGVVNLGIFILIYKKFFKNIL